MSAALIDWANLPNELMLRCMEFCLIDKTLKRAMEMRTVNKKFRSIVDMLLQMRTVVKLPTPVESGYTLQWVLDMISEKCPRLEELTVCIGNGTGEETITDDHLERFYRLFENLHTVTLTETELVSDRGYRALARLPLRSVDVYVSELASDQCVVDIASECAETLETFLVYNGGPDGDRVLVTDRAAAAISTCSGLTKLHLYETPVHRASFDEIIRGCTELTDLYLTQSPGLDWAKLASLQALVSLELPICQLVDVELNTIVNSCPNLTKLDISENFLLSDYSALAGLPRLRDLSVAWCHLGDAAFQVIARSCPRLTHLSVTGNFEKFIGFTGLCRLYQLKVFEARSCKLTDTQLNAIIGELKTKKSIKFVRLTGVGATTTYERCVLAKQQMEAIGCDFDLEMPPEPEDEEDDEDDDEEDV